jgi:hypothetical protein
MEKTAVAGGSGESKNQISNVKTAESPPCGDDFVNFTFSIGLPQAEVRPGESAWAKAHPAVLPDGRASGMLGRRWVVAQ